MLRESILSFNDRIRMRSLPENASIGNMSLLEAQSELPECGIPPTDEESTLPEPAATPTRPANQLVGFANATSVAGDGNSNDIVTTEETSPERDSTTVAKRITLVSSVCIGPGRSHKRSALLPYKVRKEDKLDVSEETVWSPVLAMARTNGWCIWS